MVGPLESDPRRTFITHAIADSISLPGQQASVSNYASGRPVIKLSNAAGYPEGCELQMLMTKTQAGPLTLHDIPTNLSISTVVTSPMDSLYHSLRSVYAPLLGGGEAAAGGAHQKGGGIPMNRQLQDLLSQLEAGLGMALRKGSQAKNSGLDLTAINAAPLQAILSPEDEIQLWADLAGDPGTPLALRKGAAQIEAAFRPLGPRFGALREAAGVDEEAVLELIDAAHQALEVVWEVRAPDMIGGFAYSQRRMAHLLGLLGHAVTSAVQQLLAGDIWRTPFADVEPALRGGLRIVGQWQRVVQDLTAVQWPSAQHAWEGRHGDEYLAAFHARLEEVVAIRETQAELAALLGMDEAESLVGEFAAPAWASARADYESRMGPGEQRISQKLRELIKTSLLPALTAANNDRGDRSASNGAQPHQVFAELKRYAGLLARPSVAAALQPEMAALVDQTDRHLSNLQAEFEHHREDIEHTTRERANGPSGSASASSAHQIGSIVWALQARQKVDRVIETLHIFAGSTRSQVGESAASTEAVAVDLRRELREWKDAQFKGWQAGTMDQLDEIKLDPSGRLLQVDPNTGHINLHYSEQLVVLLREVRQLQALGFLIRREVLAEVETAAKFYRHSLVLKQVVNFHNEMATQIIYTQKPMLTQLAIAFNDVLLKPTDSQGRPISWQNAAALEGYVRRLQQVAQQLTEKNRRLRHWHKLVGDKVVALMGCELVRGRERWASGVRELREVFVAVEREGFPEASQAGWRLHWDYQLYKALEHQYRRGLECIGETLPQTEIRIVFKQKRLQYEPALEDIRTAHYMKHLKPFLAIPLGFKGVSDASQSPGFFRHIVDSNIAGIAKVYTAAEALYTRLQDELKKWVDWVALGTVDLDEFVDQNLTDVADWDVNFRMLKAAGRDMEKLPNEVVIECYTVSLVAMKGAVEGQMRRLHDALLASLRRKAVADKDEVETFIADGRDFLAKPASSIEEIGNARQGAKALVDKLQFILELRRKVEEKNLLLRAMAAGGAGNTLAAVDMSGVDNAWEAFTGQLQRHEGHLEEQKDQLQGHVGRQVAEFQSKVAGFASRWHELKPRGVPSGDPSLVLVKIDSDARSLAELQDEAARLTTDCAHFSMDPPDFAALEALAEDVAATKAAWSRFGDFMKDRAELAHRDWLAVRDEVWRVEEFLSKWSKSTEGTAGTDPVAIILLKEIDSYRRCLPHLKFVRGAGWERKHWSQLFNLLKMQTKGPTAVTIETLTLAHFLDKAEALAAAAEEIKALDAQAQAEGILRKALEELQVWGLERRFSLSRYASPANPSKSCALIKEWKEVMTEIGDQQSLVASLRQSPYFHLFKDETIGWETRLATLAEGLLNLNAIQRKWVYLEPIFARGALPNEQPRFRKVDEQFRQLMTTTEADSLVVRFAEIPRIRETLAALVAQLDICQRALSDFLEEKRSIFPRFYFIGDDDLLEILGQAKDPAVIQAHLKKLFAGIHSVALADDKGSITAALSVEGERVELAAPVKVDEQVESWLGRLASGMQGTLQGLLHKAVQQREFKALPSQILCLADMLAFTQKAEAAIQRGHLPRLQAELRGQLAEYTGASWEGFRVMQLKIQALVLDLIHNLEIVETLIADGTTSLDDWSWSKQLRYYPGPSGGVAVKMAEAALEYSWEYQGNAPKLVYTPLTDKCYLTLTQGMALGYGGNPYGPAGTGKTESVKALGQALARQVLVFNCDGEFDFKSMNRIFMGLVKCGAWGCFDEFNRLEENVLSAVSQQIQLIQGAIKERKPQLELLGRTIDVNLAAGIFVTLNPAGKGYGGRSKLPDNLKALFRSVAMTVPDNELIAEVLLLAEGFQAAKDLGRKTVALFGLAKQLLSPQRHYDWGLRALKTCLSIAGKLLHEGRAKAAGRAGGEAAVLSPEAECQLIIRAVRLATLPKLTFDDNARFLALLADVFPNIQVAEVSDEEVQAAVIAAAADLKLELNPGQVEKVLQLHLACNQRIGVIIVGPSGSGKSTLWRLLQAALVRLARPPRTHVLNPKAVARHKLLGHMDADTREWTDGVLTAAARAVAKEPLDQHSFIVCDGDVDPEWIESLNSVLDDNRLLTLPSGERIQFTSNVNFIFECHSLQFASPATVSRCGMLFMSKEHTNVDCILASWLAKQPEALAGKLQDWVRDYFHRALAWVTDHPIALPTPVSGLVLAALSHLDGAASSREFVAGLARGFGANMEAPVRSAFVSKLGRWAGERDLLTPAGGLDPLALIRGEEVDPFAMAEALHGGKLCLMVTGGVAQDIALIAPWLKSGVPFLLVGPSGCGKSMLLAHCFANLRGTAVATMSCSAQTTAANVIQKLLQVCGTPVATANGRALRPKDSERLILYLRDINLPHPDKYDTIQVIAFLQQLLTYNGYYDDSLEFIGLERVQVVCSLNLATTVGRHALTQRFTALVRIAHISYPGADQLVVIYTQVLEKALQQAALQNPQLQLHAIAPKLAATMLDMYHGLRGYLSASDHRHYIFTPRHLTEWALGLQRYDLRSADLLQAFAYEAARVFRDRLVGPAAAARFDGLLSDALRAHWRTSLDSTPGLLFVTLATPVEERLASNAAAAPLSAWSRADLLAFVSDKLKGYEREHKELHIVLFGEVLERLARLDRVLSQPGGAALLCGSSGVGRRSALSLVAYMHHMELVSPATARGYGVAAFRADLKAVLLKAGVERVPVCLFLEDHQLEDPAILECINSLLSGGEVPGLFSNEELESSLAPLRDAAAAQGFMGQSLFGFFTAAVQRNLRIVVSMDPANPAFQARCEANPALFTRCSIQWLPQWGPEGAQAVPAAQLADLLADSPDELRRTLIAQLIAIHESRRGAPPRQFVTFVGMYRKLYVKKRDELTQQQTFLQGGLSKLAEAAVTVDTLSREAAQQRQLLQKKQGEAEAALQGITVAMEQASARRQEVAVLQKQLGSDQVVIADRRIGVESELTEVAPLIEEARRAVGQIRADHLNEIRSLKAPPDAIRDVLEGVLKLMGQADTSWNSMKRFLSNRSVKEEIINYDAHRITPEMRKSVEKLLEAKGNSFQQAVIYRASVAAAPLAAWVVANLKFSVVLEKVAPLESELNALTATFNQSQERISECEGQLQQLDGSVAQLKRDFEQRKGEEIELKAGLAKAEGTLTAAQELLSKLGGEKERWESQVAELGHALMKLPQGTLMAAAFITYLPGEPEDARAAAVATWAEILGLRERFALTQFLSSESEMLTWKAEGMPSDQLSKENAIVILQSLRTPLIIDPSTQASEWLTAHMTANNVTFEVATMHDDRFPKALELAVRFGKTLVVQEVDRIEPMLYPLLRGDLIRRGPRTVVHIGDKLVDFNDTFRLVLMTRNPAPHLPPDVVHLITVTNFTVTRSGLEGQLLGLTIQSERPELEAQRSELLHTEERLKVQLAALEKQLLHALATSQGNLLDNKALLDSLNETKAKSMTIASSLEGSRALQATLDEQREAYRSLAARGAALFFLMRDLRALSHMYQFSLNVFLGLFKKALLTSTPSSSVAARNAVLGASLTQLVCAYVGRSLFNADALTFGMHLAHCMAPQLCSPVEWDLLLGKLLGHATAVSVPLWVRDENRPAFIALATHCPDLVAACGLANGQAWGPWMLSSSPEAQLPSNKATAFQQLLLIQALRPDRLESAMTSFVQGGLGVPSIKPAALSLPSLVEHESTAGEPLLFITTPGADPSQELEEVAGRTVCADRYHQVAMGQGQTDAALQLLHACAQSGDWLCLKNLHLMVGWLPVLEKAVFALTPHQDFRLFLTSEPHPSFPSTLLEACLKVTFEAPPGLKRNLQRTYEAWGPQFVGAGTPLRAQLLFMLAWFHGIVQERRTYIPQGWSKFYEFSFSDLRSGADLIGLGTAGGKVPQWKYLHGLLENAIYGGRVDSPYDIKVLRAYLEQLFSPEAVGIAGARVRPLPGTRNLVAPASAHAPDYLAFIAGLPDADVPALFGLPANIDRAAQQANSARVITQLKQMATSQAAGGAFDRQSWTAQLGPLLKLWDSLIAANPQLQRLSNAMKAPPRAGAAASPLDAFVALECSKAQQLVGAMSAELSELAGLLNGTSGLTPAMQELGTSLVADSIPGTWEALWEGPPQPLLYCQAVAERAGALEQWAALAAAGQLWTSALTLSHLFNPGALLNALRQSAAQRLPTPIDNLKLVTSWEPSGLQGAVSITVTGLLIQSALFDGRRMSPVEPSSPTSSPIPAVTMAWIPQDHPDPIQPHLSLPLYLSDSREHVLADVQLPISSLEERRQWILAGAALFLAA
ncbi:hypothetical protein WJX72_008353 [[Myrmecia] bisecta]|uniref:Cytoplasmic dynein 2 heavy chain 1 n=1 Tax=[Myrmecia] bisecta TaxID=41462 RepID=A0AAW1Q1V1_9CHLO